MHNGSGHSEATATVLLDAIRVTFALFLHAKPHSLHSIFLAKRFVLHTFVS